MVWGRDGGEDDTSVTGQIDPMDGSFDFFPFLKGVFGYVHHCLFSCPFDDPSSVMSKEGGRLIFLSMTLFMSHHSQIKSSTIIEFLWWAFVFVVACFFYF